MKTHLIGGSCRLVENMVGRNEWWLDKKRGEGGGGWGAVDQLGSGDVCCSDLPWFMTFGTLRCDTKATDVQEKVAEK